MEDTSLGLELDLGGDAVEAPEALILPVLPIRDMVIFPGIVTPLFVGRPKSLKAIESAVGKDRTILVVAQKDLKLEDPNADDLFGVGTVCTILQMLKIPDGTLKVLVQGDHVARVESFSVGEDMITAQVSPVDYQVDRDEETEPLRRSVLEQFERYVGLHPKVPAEVFAPLSEEAAERVADLVASHLLVSVAEKQLLLEATSVNERLRGELKLLIKENELLEMEHSIHERVRREMERGHREYYLREQLKAIQEELGSSDGVAEVEEYRAKIDRARMPKEAKEKARYELDRLSKMPPTSAEATVSRTYLDWLLALPWSNQTKDRLEIGVAKSVLDEDHYGLKEVKDRIIEFLAVRKLAGGDTRAQVLCFVGPPGVGKTSLARSIARALNRKFVSMSLGGVRDEAEIRGHRRTYVGALPGRIIQKIRQAGVKNPVMLMDEIDKLGTDFRGDPSAALLEVLDPEQNQGFSDHFLEVPFDLSRVMFITTANDHHSIPKPLLDRMEVISIPGYVLEEKVNIAERHLWPRILKENGLSGYGVSITRGAISKVISDYTREAGVRNLDRQLSKIARKIAYCMVSASEEGKVVKPPKIVPGSLVKFLGAPRGYDASIPKEGSVGTVVGLAWTESGGDVLLIEAASMLGKGSVSFTGNLGDIMRESAQAAVGFLRSNALSLKMGDVKWDQVDLHVHVPEGAIPKDGPSAGVALALAICSAVRGTAVRTDVAVTGEITLRGAVLAVGGIREKCLAAKRHGIKEVVLPAANRPDVEEMPEWAKRGLTFHFVSSMDEVFPILMGE
jgi:ATP-dependent Lon protease